MLDGGPATVGVIASVTAPFCGDCDRVRLTADGQLRNCLFSTTEYDLMPILRDGGVPDAAGIDGMLRACVRGKLPGTRSTIRGPPAAPRHERDRR